MRKISCIQERDVVRCSRNAIENMGGQCTLSDSDGLRVDYVCDGKVITPHCRERTFNVVEYGGLLTLQIGDDCRYSSKPMGEDVSPIYTLGYLMMLSVTSEECRLITFDETYRDTVSLAWYELGVVYRPGGWHHGALLNLADGHCIKAAHESRIVDECTLIEVLAEEVLQLRYRLRTLDNR